MDVDLRPQISVGSTTNRLSDKNTGNTATSPNSSNAAGSSHQVVDDKLEFTEEALMLQEAERRLSTNDSNSNSERIEALTGAITSGQYQPNYEVVAEKIIKSESQLYV